MPRTSSSRPLQLLPLLLAIACGGKTTTSNPAGPPTAVVKIAGDGQSATVGSVVATRPAVKVTDVDGIVVSGVAVTFAVASGGGSITGGSTTTNSSGVATVGSWALGSSAGANTLTATVTGSGISGNPVTFTATGTPTSTGTAFSPTSNTSLSGSQTFTSVNIPGGVTVTLTADAAITVSGAVTIAGSITGDCVNLTMMITGAFTSTGNINNGCPGELPAAGPPSMTIVAQGGYFVNGGTYTLGGDLNLTNDGALTDGTFATAPALLQGNHRATGGSGQVGVCRIAAGAAFIANPLTAKAGTNGQTGGAGRSGSTWTLQCTGGLDFTGAATVRGQNGGPGGTGTHVGNPAIATGGAGGLGGTIKVRAVGDINFSGPGDVIQSGNGGAGGSATATGNAVGNPGASATSTGGAGNAPGNIQVKSLNGGVSIAGLTLTMGAGGSGGGAISLASDGQGPCVPGVGGAATATGGVGGSTPDKTLTATGAVTGLANVTVNGGAAGNGGNAKATSGTGGNGAQPCKNGAKGGDATASGGNGGNALIKNASSALIANGGNGGSMEDAVGKGGTGWSDCIATPFEPGGNGGAGGAAGGRNGLGGSGLVAGTPGAATFTTVSDGGNGGNGAGPGGGGAAGGNSATLTVAPTIVQPSFIPGNPGAACVAEVIPKYSAIPNSGGVVSPGTRLIPLVDNATSGDVGTVSYTTTGTTFIGSGPGRIGIAANSNVAFGVGSMIVNAVKYVATTLNTCVLNSPGVGPSNPITVRAKNASGTVVGTQTITSQTCQDFPVPSDADLIETFGPVQADIIFLIKGRAFGP